MKEFLEKLIKNKKEQMKELQERAQKSEDINEVRSLGDSLITLRDEINDAEEQLKKYEENGGDESNQDEESNSRSMRQDNIDVRAFNPLASYSQNMSRSDMSNVSNDVTSTEEYRSAFMKFIQTGEYKDVLRNAHSEVRADQITQTSDVSAVIPTHLMDRIIEKLEKRGEIWASLTKLNLQGGVEYPILGLKPVATRIKEDTVSDKQKVQAKEKVSFLYHGLECKISQSLLASIVSLNSFENKFVDLIVEAMIKRIEFEVFNGTGEGEGLGILKDKRVLEEQKLEISSADISKYNKWCEIFGSIPVSYESSGKWYMTKKTYETVFKGMVDANGNPIARLDYTEGRNRMLDGYDVCIVEDDVLKSYQTAEAGEAFMVFVDLTEYAVNTNLEMTMIKYTDHDLNQVIDKGIMICDGKLLDTNGVIIVKKQSSAQV